MRNSVVILDLNLSTRYSGNNIYDKLILHPFQEGKDYGFFDMSVEGDILDAVFLARNNVYVNRYDEPSKRIVREKLTYVSESGFRIDFSKHILEYFGNKADFSYFKRILKTILIDFSLDSIHLNLKNKIDDLSENLDKLQLQFIKIPQFKYSEHLIGKFQAKVYDHREGRKLLNDYGKDVSAVRFVFGGSDTSIELTKNYQITAYCDRLEFLSIIEKLK
jgi:hypothetical protein